MVSPNKLGARSLPEGSVFFDDNTHMQAGTITNLVGRCVRGSLMQWHSLLAAELWSQRPTYAAVVKPLPSDTALGGCCQALQPVATCSCRRPW